MSSTSIILIPILPLLSFIILGLTGKSYAKHAGVIGTLLLLTSLFVSLYCASTYFSSGAGAYIASKPIEFPWLIFANGLSIHLGVLQDPISMMMIIVVTLISTLVHIFSLTYMKGEERFHIYYAFLGLFTFSMLGLVLSSNLFQIYIFWELVGVSSFLLIGFFYKKSSALAAAKKAFIVTRFADLGFLMGILVLSNQAGTLDFIELISRLSQPGDILTSATTVSFIGVSALSWGLALVFLGAAGKSAMFPLHIWLPDAMEGPTPVSALIHAATMVVAGVFLVARLYPVYAYSGTPVLGFIGYIGVFTALFAAVIATTQTDIKRVLAYSTISQIGFMMFALAMVPKGSSAAMPETGFTASMFHLFTHAIFKALLFLAAGSVIHYVHSNDMNNMGGLRKYMPITHWMFLIACLAIAGVPPFAGFFSKEEILLAAWENNRLIYYAALITSGLTAFYMFRLYFSIFWNKTFHSNVESHGEGTAAMLVPLILLGIGSAASGFIPFGQFVSSNGKALQMDLHLIFSIAPVAIGLLGIFIAMLLYKTESAWPEKISTKFGSVYQVATNKFYIDEIWMWVTKHILFGSIAQPIAWFDRNVVDGMIKGMGTATEWFSWRIKGLQSGRVQQYGIFFLMGIIIIISVYLLRYS